MTTEHHPDSLAGLHPVPASIADPSTHGERTLDGIIAQQERRWRQNVARRRLAARLLTYAVPAIAVGAVLTIVWLVGYQMGADATYLRMTSHVGPR